MGSNHLKNPDVGQSDLPETGWLMPVCQAVLENVPVTFSSSNGLLIVQNNHQSQTTHRTKRFLFVSV